MPTVIDTHTHVFPEKVVDKAMAALEAAYGAQPIARPTPAELLRHMDTTGVNAAVVCPVATRADQVASINRWAAGLASDRLIPFGALHPADPNCDEQIAFLLGQGLRGVKLQPHFQEFDLLAPATLEMLEKLAGRLVVLLHAGQEIRSIATVDPTPARLLKLHQALPEVQLIVAHLGGYQMWEEVEEHLVGQDLYMDLAYTFDEASDEQIARIIQNHGPQRILFASDFPWQSPADVLAGLERLDLSEQHRDMILGGNAARLLRA